MLKTGKTVYVKREQYVVVLQYSIKPDWFIGTFVHCKYHFSPFYRVTALEIVLEKVFYTLDKP